jgi:hypothetical protein
MLGLEQGFVYVWDRSWRLETAGEHNQVLVHAAGVEVEAPYGLLCRIKAAVGVFHSPSHRWTL